MSDLQHNHLWWLIILNVVVLIDDIIGADESKAEPLSPEQKRIITRIAMKFSQERMVYDAAHKEKIWKRQPNGAIIPYTDSSELIGI